MALYQGLYVFKISRRNWHVRNHQKPSVYMSTNSLFLLLIAPHGTN